MRNIAILYGGVSSEHDASLSSFANTFAALDRDRVRVTLTAYIGRDGRIHVDSDPAVRPESELRALAVIDHAQLPAILKKGWTLSLLHGQNGEDGVIAGWARTHGLPGSWGDVLGDALGMAKWASGPIAAELMGADGTVPATRLLRSRDLARGHVDIDIDGPLVIKPGGSGASIKTFKVSGWSPACLTLVADVLTISPTAVVQECVTGREYSVGVVDLDDRVTALPVVRIDAGDGHVFYDHAAKHQAGATRKVFEDDLTTRRLQRLSERLFIGLGGFGMARLDFIVRPDGLPVYLETNTLPGLMKNSIYPAMLAHAGLTLTDLVESLFGADARRRVRELDVRFDYSIEEH